MYFYNFALDNTEPGVSFTRQRNLTTHTTLESIYTKYGYINESIYVNFANFAIKSLVIKFVTYLEVFLLKAIIQVMKQSVQWVQVYFIMNTWYFCRRKHSLRAGNVINFVQFISGLPKFFKGQILGVWLIQRDEMEMLILTIFSKLRSHRLVYPVR